MSSNGDMDLFAYVSRSKVQQLFDQLSSFSATEITEKRGGNASGEIDTGAGALFGFLRAGFKATGAKTYDLEKRGAITSIQMLKDVLARIEANKKVLNLNELCKASSGQKLDAFAYFYEGAFDVLASFSPSNNVWGGIQVKEAALERSDEVMISKAHLVDPGRSENSFAETGPNNGKLVSDICVISSSCQDFRISLSCSYKFFSDMGGSWDERNKEWHVVPHSGNHRFFDGEQSLWFRSLLFVTGVRDKTIMGTPLYLAYGIDPDARI